MNSSLSAFNPKTRHAIWTFVVIAAGFLLLRFTIILTAVEYVAHYDELDLGTLARELLQGLKMPFKAYQLDAYSGESLILGPLVIPFFKLFGQNLFAVKMVPLFFSFLTLLLIYSFTLRNFGQKPATVAALLYTFSMPMLTQLSLVGMAGHCEASFLSLLILFAFYDYFYKGKKWTSLIFWGWICGFGLWFYYATAIMIGACCLSWLLISRSKFFNKDLLVFIIFFILGFSPWLILNTQNSFRGIELLAENLANFQSQHQMMLFLGKNLALLGKGIPTSFASLPVFFIHEHVYSWIYFLSFLFLLTPWIFKYCKKPEFLPLILYPFLFILVLMSCFFTVVRDIGFVGYRYVTPLYLVLILLAALALSEIRRVFLIFFLALGILGHTAFLFKEPFARALSYQGYSYYQLGTRWRLSMRSRLFDRYDNFRQMTFGFSPQERRFLIWGMVDMAILDHDSVLIEGGDITVKSILPQESAPLDKFLYEWLGASQNTTPEQMKTWLEESHYSQSIQTFLCKGWITNWQQTELLSQCPNCIDQLPKVCVQNVYWLGFFYPDWENPAWNRFIKSLPKLESENRVLLYRSIGHAFFLEERFSQINLWRKYQPLIAAIPEQDRFSFYEGIGWGIRERFREDRTRALDWISKLPLQAQAGALEGAQAFEKWYQLA